MRCIDCNNDSTHTHTHSVGNKLNTPKQTAYQTRGTTNLPQSHPNKTKEKLIITYNTECISHVDTYSYRYVWQGSEMLKRTPSKRMINALRLLNKVNMHKLNYAHLTSLTSGYCRLLANGQLDKGGTLNTKGVLWEGFEL